jgi:uroporphyrinogen-III synthase
MKIPSVFISRYIEDSSPMRKLKINLIAQSLITIQSQTFVIPERSFDWIFFSSPNAVKHFYSNCAPMKPSVRLAAIGEGTAKMLRNYGQIDFIGSSDIQSSAYEFASMVGKQSVLFPIGDRSLHSFQSALNPEQFDEVICYQTALMPQIIGACDMYIFSSPSNVVSFFSVVQNIPDDAVFLSFGRSTEKELMQHGIKSGILGSTSEASICDAIIRIFPVSMPDSYL